MVICINVSNKENNMLRNYIIEHRGSVILNTVNTVSLMGESPIAFNLYHILNPITGYWHKYRTEYLADDDAGAIAMLDSILDLKYIPAPTTATYEKNIRDEYLPAVYNENFQIIEYKGYGIWSGFNDSSNTGYYWVSAPEDGADIGTSYTSIKEAMEHIDKMEADNG
jgi:hypothetical protein